MANKTSILILILILIIVVLAGILAYIFILKPTINGYVIQGQNEGFEVAVVSIMQRAAPPSCQVVPLFYNNQTVNIVSVECLSQTQTQQSGQVSQEETQ